MAENHHVIPQQRIKQAVSAIAIKERRFEELTDAERRLLETPLSTVLDDQRNIVRLSRTRHHRAHHHERLKRSDLPRGIEDFAADYALEAALDHELRLIDNDGPAVNTASPPKPPACDRHDSTRADGFLDDRCLLCGAEGYWRRGEEVDPNDGKPRVIRIHPSGKALISTEEAA